MDTLFLTYLRVQVLRFHKLFQCHCLNNYSLLIFSTPPLKCIHSFSQIHTFFLADSYILSRRFIHSFSQIHTFFLTDSEIETLRCPPYLFGSNFFTFLRHEEGHLLCDLIANRALDILDISFPSYSGGLG